MVSQPLEVAFTDIETSELEKMRNNYFLNISAAPAGQQASPVTNQGYYYYYYPVRQGGAAAQESDDGLLGGLLGGGLLSAILGKKVIVVAIAIAALLVAIAFGLNLSIGGRAFPDYSLLSEENLVLASDMLRRAIEIYGN